MTFDVQIGVTSRAIQDGSLSIESSIGNRSHLSATIRSMNGSYRPDIGDEIYVTQDAVVIFGGTIEHTTEVAADGNVSLGALDTRVTAIDFRGKADRRVLFTSRSSETLKARITYFATLMNAVGVSGSQVDGPTLESVTYDGQTIADALNDIALLTGYGWDIDSSSVLRMQLPSVNTAPFNLTTASGLAVGDIVVEPSREGYANHVIVRAGDTRAVEKTDAFTGNGSTSAWTLTYTPVGDRGYVTANGNFETLGATGSGASWILSGTTLTRAAGNLTNGHVVTIVYDAQFPIYVTAENAGEVATYGQWDVLVNRPETFDIVEAQAFADAELAARLTGMKTVRYSTFEPGLKPGQQQTITVSGRNLSSAAAVITEVVTTNDAGKDRLRHQVTAQTGSAWNTWSKVYQSWSGGSGAGTSSVTGGVGVSISIGQSPDGNIKAQSATDYETEIGQHPVMGGLGGTRMVDGAGDQWYTGIIPTSGSRYQWALYDTNDGGSKPSVAVFYSATNGAYIFGPPENSPTNVIDIGRNITSAERIRNIWSTQTSASSGFLERGRTTALGVPINVTHDGSNFTGSGSLSWTVESGDQVVFRYSLVGLSARLSVSLVTTSVSGTGVELLVALPFTPTGNIAHYVDAIDNGAVTKVFVDISSGKLRFRRSDLANWAASTNSTNVFFEGDIPV